MSVKDRTFAICASVHVPYCYLHVQHVYLSVCVDQVISGQQLPKVNQKEGSIVDPLVRVEVYGVPKDQAKEETNYINNNGEKQQFSCTDKMRFFGFSVYIWS